MPTTAAITAGVGAAASLGSAAIGASAQTKAAGGAEATQLGMFNTAAGYEEPFIQGGQNALTGYENALPTLTKPYDPSMLASTPGYQFTLNQGLKATQNSYAANGLGSSGAAEKGAVDYATGDAQATYNQQLTNYLTQNQQIANLLYQPVQTGANAANTLTGAAVGTGAGIANSLTGGGNAIAGAATGGANAVTGAGNTALQYQLIQQLLASKQGQPNALATTPNWGGTPVPYTNNPFDTG